MLQYYTAEGFWQRRYAIGGIWARCVVLLLALTAARLQPVPGRHLSIKLLFYRAFFAFLSVRRGNWINSVAPTTAARSLTDGFG